jgi:glycosyltransferase involved in cell wall biosynthesis
MSTPLVSVCCTTYNHEQFIQEAIESFLTQKTTFEFEILIHDDASTDKTQEIITKYKRQHPDLIQTIFQSQNQYSNGHKPSPEYVWPKARGKYIALCEGDDYWVDPNKLQKQVDYMELNESCSVCFHNATIKVMHKKNKTKTFCNLSNTKFYTKEIISLNWFVPTPSIVFRKSMLITPNWYWKIYNGDLAMLLLLSTKGYLYYINEKMAVYRRHNSNINNSIDKRTSTLKIIEVLHYFNIVTEFKYHKTITERTNILLKVLENNILYQKSLKYKLIKIMHLITKQ